MKIPKIPKLNFSGFAKPKILGGIVKNLEKIVFLILEAIWLVMLVTCLIKLYTNDVRAKPIRVAGGGILREGIEVDLKKYEEIEKRIKKLKEGHGGLDLKITKDIFCREEIEIDPVIEEMVVDSDKDGMPDEWEKMYGLNLRKASDADEDKDVDGYTNLEEFEAGTDPTNPNSNPGDIEFLLRRYTLKAISRETVSLIFMGYTQWKPEYLDLQINWQNMSFFPRIWRVSEDNPDIYEGFHITEERYKEELEGKISVGKPSINSSSINKIRAIPELDHSIVQAIINSRQKSIVKHISDLLEFIQLTPEELTVVHDKVAAEVNVNNCSENELAEFFGISASNAKKVVAYRGEKGYYKNLKEFLRVADVPTSRLKEIKDILVAKLDINSANRKDIIKFFEDERLADAILFYREVQGLFKDKYDVVSRGRIQGYWVISCEVKIRELPPKPGRPYGQKINESETVIRMRGSDPVLLQFKKVTQGKELFARVYDKTLNKDVMWNAGTVIGSDKSKFEIVEINKNEVVLSKRGDKYLLKYSGK